MIMDYTGIAVGFVTFMLLSGKRSQNGKSSRLIGLMEENNYKWSFFI